MPDITFCPVVLGWPCLTSTEWAAWFQAVGAILAIGVAILVPAMQHRYAAKSLAREQHLRKVSMALAVFSDLKEFERGTGEFLDYGDPHEKDLTNPAWRELIKIPPRLNAVAQQLHELGDAAPNVVAVMASLLSAGSKFSEAVHGVYAREHPYDSRDAVIEHLKTARKAASAAITELRVLLEAR